MAYYATRSQPTSQQRPASSRLAMPLARTTPALKKEPLRRPTAPAAAPGAAATTSKLPRVAMLAHPSKPASAPAAATTRRTPVFFSSMVPQQQSKPQTQTQTQTAVAMMDTDDGFEEETGNLDAILNSSSNDEAFARGAVKQQKSQQHVPSYARPTVQAQRRATVAPSAPVQRGAPTAPAPRNQPNHEVIESEKRKSIYRGALRIQPKRLRFSTDDGQPLPQQQQQFLPAPLQAAASSQQQQPAVQELSPSSQRRMTLSRIDKNIDDYMARNAAPSTSNTFVFNTTVGTSFQMSVATPGRKPVMGVSSTPARQERIMSAKKIGNALAELQQSPWIGTSDNREQYLDLITPRKHVPLSIASDTNDTQDSMVTPFKPHRLQLCPDSSLKTPVQQPSFMQPQQPSFAKPSTEEEARQRVIQLQEQSRQHLALLRGMFEERQKHISLLSSSSATIRPNNNSIAQELADLEEMEQKLQRELEAELLKRPTTPPGLSLNSKTVPVEEETPGRMLANATKRALSLSEVNTPPRSSLRTPSVAAKKNGSLAPNRRRSRSPSSIGAEDEADDDDDDDDDGAQFTFWKKPAAIGQENGVFSSVSVALPAPVLSTSQTAHNAFSNFR